ncbi:MAG TPA: hypothetical protein VF461_21055 [Gemmatimonadaceae bacterium]
MRRISAARQRVRVLALVTLSSAWLSACGSDTPNQPSSIAGTYTATVFRVTPTGQPTIDVLAQGGSLQITIASDNTASGSLSLPASVAGTPFTASMTGTVVQSGTTVQFQQTADTFVRDLTFAVVGNTLQATNQVAGVGSFTITLTRQ